MTFGEKVKAVRLKLFMSQKAFAKEMGVVFTTVNRWENGHRQPNFKAQADFDKLCKKHQIEFTINGIKE